MKVSPRNCTFIGLGLLALLVVVGLQHRASEAQAQRLSVDAKCAAEAANPPEAFKRSLPCLGWSPKADQSLPPRG